MGSRQEGDILLAAPLGFGIEFLAGTVTMTGGFDTAVQLSLFGGNFDDDGSPATASKQWWGNLTETSEEFWYRSRTQFLLQSIPAVSGNLRLIEQAAKQDLSWLLDLNIATTVDVLVSIPALNRVQIDISILAQGEESSFSFTENWGWLLDDANRVPTGLALRAPLPPRGPVPSDFLGLSLWLDASDLTSLTKTGDLVDLWADKSGAGKTGDFAPYDAAAKASHGLVADQLNGLDVVSFPSGVDFALIGTGTEALPGTDGYSIMAVVAETAAAEGQIVGKGSNLGTTEYAFLPDRLTSQRKQVNDPLASLKSLQSDVATQELEATGGTVGVSSNWTVSVWWKPTDLNAVPILNIGDGSTGGPNLIHIGYSGVANRYRVAIRNSASSANKLYEFPGVAVVGQFINLTVSYNHTTGDLLLYQDGSPVVANKITDDTPLFMTDSPDRVIGFKTQNQIAVNGLGIGYSAAVWAGDLAPSEILAIYNLGNGQNAILTQNFGGYTQSAALRHWYRLGFATGADIGKDYGSLPRDMISTGGSPFDDGDIVDDFPVSAAQLFSDVDLGTVDLVPKILSVVVDGGTALATARGYKNGVLTQFQNDFEAFKPNPQTPDSPAPPHAVGGQFNGLATTITRRFEGSIAELLVFDRALSDAERGLLEIYFGEKWGVTI
jgi:phage gp46-like protein